MTRGWSSFISLWSSRVTNDHLNHSSSHRLPLKVSDADYCATAAGGKDQRKIKGKHQRQTKESIVWRAIVDYYQCGCSLNTDIADE